MEKKNGSLIKFELLVDSIKIGYRRDVWTSIADFYLSMGFERGYITNFFNSGFGGFAYRYTGRENSKLVDLVPNLFFSYGFGAIDDLNQDVFYNKKFNIGVFRVIPGEDMTLKFKIRQFPVYRAILKPISEFIETLLLYAIPSRQFVASIDIVEINK